MFPGQGSHFVGMGSDLFSSSADLLGEFSDNILGWSLRQVCLSGPEEKLTSTQHAQPALFALSLVLWYRLSAQLSLPPAAFVGHSLGEYTALAGAGVWDFETGLHVVAERGKAMAIATQTEPSGMSALIGAEEDQVTQIIQRRRRLGGRLELANLNAPGQVVVSGAMEDLDWLENQRTELGIRRVVRLDVAGGFHSQFMASAASHMQDVLDQTGWDQPHHPVYSNVTAQPALHSQLGEMLVRQITAPVRFAPSLENMSSLGINTFVHVGPGEVTAGLARRTLPQAKVLSVSSETDIAPVAEELSKIV